MDFQERKVLEIFRYALNRQGFLIKGLASWPLHYALCSMRYASFPMRHAFLTVLPDPAGIPVACCPDENFLRRSSQLEIL
jgi:hypothetical protein